MEYSFEIDASKGLVKATGDRPFVESVIEKYQELIKAAPNPTPALSGDRSVAQKVSPEEQRPQPNGSIGSLDDYGSVFDVTDGKATIIADVPGSTQSAKAKNLALLYCFAKLKLGDEIVANEEVREVCKSHAVYDPTNFASQMKSQKKLVLANGSKGSPNFTLKLTVPGRKAAEELAREIEASS